MEKNFINKLKKFRSKEKIDLLVHIIDICLVNYNNFLKVKFININILFNLLYIIKVFSCLKKKNIKIFITTNKIEQITVTKLLIPALKKIINILKSNKKKKYNIQIKKVETLLLYSNLNKKTTIFINNFYGAISEYKKIFNLIKEESKDKSKYQSFNLEQLYNSIIETLKFLFLESNLGEASTFISDFLEKQKIKI